MGEELDIAKKKIERRKRLKRRKSLLSLLQDISDGTLNTRKEPLSWIFNQEGPRNQYISPQDRGTYNYGYMEEKEMLAGTPYQEK
jgi:hypothetical protein